MTSEENACSKSHYTIETLKADFVKAAACVYARSGMCFD